MTQIRQFLLKFFLFGRDGNHIFPVFFFLDHEKDKKDDQYSGQNADDDE